MSSAEQMGLAMVGRYTMFLLVLNHSSHVREITSHSSEAMLFPRPYHFWDRILTGSTWVPHLDIRCYEACLHLNWTWTHWTRRKSLPCQEHTLTAEPVWVWLQLHISDRCARQMYLRHHFIKQPEVITKYTCDPKMSEFFPSVKNTFDVEINCQLDLNQEIFHSQLFYPII